LVDQLEVRVTQRHVCIDVPLIDGGDRPAHNLYVLLRHRPGRISRLTESAASHAKQTFDDYAAFCDGQRRFSTIRRASLGETYRAPAIGKAPQRRAVAAPTSLWLTAALRKETSASNATAYSASQQLITTAWNVLFALALVTWVFGWAGGKELVRTSYGQAR
jgi:hypothetical protein